MKILQKKLQAIIYSSSWPPFASNYQYGASHVFERNLTYLFLNALIPWQLECRMFLSWLLNDCFCLKAEIIAAKNRSTSSRILIIHYIHICSSGDPDFVGYCVSRLWLANLLWKKDMHFTSLASLDTNPSEIILSPQEMTCK